MLVCGDMLLSLNPEVKWENETVLDLIVAKWLGTVVDIVVIHTEVGVPIVSVSLDDSEGIDPKELSSLPILIVFMLVTVKLEEE